MKQWVQKLKGASISGYSSLTPRGLGMKVPGALPKLSIVGLDVEVSTIIRGDSIDVRYPHDTYSTELECIEPMSITTHTTSVNVVSGRHMGIIKYLVETSDGYVRVHDSLPNHRAGAIKLLGYPEDVGRSAVAAKVAKWRSVDLENAAVDAGALIATLRGYEQWDVLPHTRAIKDFPI
ncbi:uncharacterized protein PV07_08674 [Cladophialophora immunda]|uniref:Uncharacterized protein n=1 Tax=Cladophialophora immunda TaxID=569365 RepID=A0A0D2C2U9_9EURO|nr:uncharacterized protein PV07_08674 [Cladophialophora immunda]KIW25508.1 hypothetical protein PV07_08674 [Cladophialophora immunda]